MSRNCSLLSLTPLYIFVSKKLSDLHFLHLICEFDTRVKVIWLDHNCFYSLLFCLDLCSIGKHIVKNCHVKQRFNYPGWPETYYTRFPVWLRLYSELLEKLSFSCFSRGFTSSDFCLQPKICRPVADRHQGIQLSHAKKSSGYQVTGQHDSVSIQVFYYGHEDVSRSCGHHCSHVGSMGLQEEFLVGFCCVALQILTLYFDYSMTSLSFHTRFHAWPLKPIPVFRPGIGWI